jgi:hypothetical protein
VAKRLEVIADAEIAATEVFLDAGVGAFGGGSLAVG